jgi:hypothetical protein
MSFPSRSHLIFCILLLLLLLLLHVHPLDHLRMHRTILIRGQPLTSVNTWRVNQYLTLIRWEWPHLSCDVIFEQPLPHNVHERVNHRHAQVLHRLVGAARPVSVTQTKGQARGSWPPPTFDSMSCRSSSVCLRDNPLSAVTPTSGTTSG